MEGDAAGSFARPGADPGHRGRQPEGDEDAEAGGEEERHPRVSAVGKAVQGRGDEVQPQRRQEQCKQQPLAATCQGDHARHDAQQRERAAPVRAAHGIAEHRAGMRFQEPEGQLERSIQRRESGGPVGVFHRLLVHFAHRGFADDQQGGETRHEDGVQRDPRKPASPKGDGSNLPERPGGGRDAPMPWRKLAPSPFLNPSRQAMTRLAPPAMKTAGNE